MLAVVEPEQARRRRRRSARSGACARPSSARSPTPAASSSARATRSSPTCPPRRSRTTRPIYDPAMERPAYLDEVQAFDPPRLPRARDDSRTTLLALLASAQHLLAALDLGAVRPPGHAQHRRAARLATPPCCASRARRKAIAVSTRLQRPLLLPRPVRRRADRVRRGGAQRRVRPARSPRRITDCLNFGNPEKPEVFWTFYEAVAAWPTPARPSACRSSRGNVSFYNESFGTAIYPTPIVGMRRRARRRAAALRPPLQGRGRRGGPPRRDRGERARRQRVPQGRRSRGGRPLPRVDLDLEGERLQRVAEAASRAAPEVRARLLEGGLAVALAECCMAGRIGRRTRHAAAALARTSRASLFGEARSRCLGRGARARSTLQRPAEQGVGAPLGVVGGVEPVTAPSRHVDAWRWHSRRVEHGAGARSTRPYRSTASSLRVAPGRLMAGHRCATHEVQATTPKKRAASSACTRRARTSPASPSSAVALQHRGQETAGIAVPTAAPVTVDKDMGLVSHVFNEDDLAALSGDVAIGHSRYSTTGSRAGRTPSPSWSTSPRLASSRSRTTATSSTPTSCATSCSGKGIASHDHRLRGHRRADRARTATATARRVRTAVAQRSTAPSRGRAHRRRPGYGFRDPYGVRPLVLGRSTTAAGSSPPRRAGLDIIGAEFVREVEPGEIVIVDAEHGLRSERVELEGARPGPLHLRVHLLRPPRLACMDGRTLHQAPQRMGEHLATRRRSRPTSSSRCPTPASPPPSASPRASRHPLRRGPHQEPLHRPHLHPARPATCASAASA